MLKTLARPLFIILLISAPALAQDRTITLLQQLADAPGPPGFEEPVRKVLVDLMKPLSSSLTFDGLGDRKSTRLNSSH